MLKITLFYSCALIWNDIPVEIRNDPTIIFFFIYKCLTWMKDVEF